MSALAPFRRLVALALVAACDSPPQVHDEPAQLEPAEPKQLESLARTAGPPPTEVQQPMTPVAEMHGDPTPPESPRTPVTTRIARQMLVLRAAPDHDAAIRGRIPISEAFHVYALVEGENCGGKGWADVGHGAYVCLEPTRTAGDTVPRSLPEMRDGGLAPFYYAKVKQGQAGRRWASLEAWKSKQPHTDTLEAEHDYAFTNRRRVAGEVVLMDSASRVVPESDVTRYRPSRFEGRDLVAEPVPEARRLAWGVTWPENPVFSEPREDSAPAVAIDYQAEILLVEPAADGWWKVDGGFIHEKHLGIWDLPVPPADIAADDVWIDVELDSQTLTVMRGETPLFATLVSTGFKGPTPKGLFRISMKQAIGQMQSRPDAEESYNVEAVPFVQYFTGNFALHGAFWHYRFGHKISHGCVNLSPKDARRVYDMTAPRAEPGWLHAFEGEGALGSTVRVRKGDAPVEDKREAPRRFDG